MALQFLAQLALRRLNFQIIHRRVIIIIIITIIIIIIIIISVPTREFPARSVIMGFRLTVMMGFRLMVMMEFRLTVIIITPPPPHHPGSFFFMTKVDYEANRTTYSYKRLLGNFQRVNGTSLGAGAGRSSRWGASTPEWLPWEARRTH